jgi:hypothetical protein
MGPQNAVSTSLIVRGSSMFDALTGYSDLSGPSEQTAMTVSAIYAAINLKAGAIAALPVHIYRQDVTGERDRLMDVEALKNVLANLDLVSLMLRNRPPLPRGAKAMQDELRELLRSSGVLKSQRELSVLCSLLMQQQAEQSKMEGAPALTVLRAL